MTDLRTEFDALLGGGPIGEAWEIWPHRVEDSLRMVTLIVIGTDRAADDDDPLPPGIIDRRGWWADVFNGIKIGTKLWILEQLPVTAESVRLAKDYVAEGMAWMAERGYVDETIVETWRPPGTRGRLAMRVTHVTRAGRLPVFETSDLWGGLRG